MNIIPVFIRRRFAHRPNLVKIIENIGWLFFERIFRLLGGLLVGIWVIRYLGPEQFGLFSFATAFVGLFSAVAGLGLQEIVVRDIVHNPSGKEETLGTAAILQFFAGVLAYSMIIATIFILRPNDYQAKVLVAILGSVMLFRASDVAAYWFESQVLSKYIILVKNGSFLVFSAIKVALILSNSALITFVWAAMAESLLVAILMLVMLGWRGPKLKQLRFSLARAKELLRDSWPLLLSGITIMIYMKIDQIMLGQMIGDEAVGIYSAAVQISEVWYFVPTAIVASVFPAILEAKKRSERLYYERLQHLYDLMVWLSIAVALPMTFLSTTIVTLLLGDAYAQAGSVLAIHIWAAVFVFLGVASGKWFLAEKRQILSLQRTGFGTIANVILNFLLIPQFGTIGAAVATVLAQLCAAMFYDLIQKETRPMFIMKLKAINIFSAFSRYKRLLGAEKRYD